MKIDFFEVIIYIKIFIRKYLMKKIKEIYVKHPVKFRITIFFILFCLFIVNNSWLYKKPIAKVLNYKIINEETISNYSENGFPITENQYEQKVTLKLLNTKHHGEKFNITNTYTDSRTDNSKLKKGDRVFVTINDKGDKLSGSIDGVKRDSYAFLLISIFIYLMIIMVNKRGAIISITLLINIVIFATALELYSKGTDILLIAFILVIVFPIITLVFSNGFNKNTFAAIMSSFISLFIATLILKASIKYGGEIDYSALDYIVGNHDLDRIFFAGISLAGLGVIMDVSVTICASLHELSNKNPDIHIKQLFKAGREIGFDIMGTMINVLLFTYVCGLMPLIIIKMKNGISLLSIIKLQIPFEISSFLMGSIEILITIPVSIGISSILFKKGRNKL